MTVTLHTLSLDLATGEVSLDARLVDRGDIVALDGQSILFLNEPFTLSVASLRDASRDPSLTLFWSRGKCAELGWEAGQDELLSDRDQLAKRFARFAQIEPQQVSLPTKVFTFAWGDVIAGCSLQAVLVSLSIHWHAHGPKNQ